MTTVISSIDSSGSGDYTTMAAWESATDIDLVAKAITDGSPALEIAEIVDDDTITDVNGLNMSGATTDIDSHRIVRSAGVKFDVISGVGPTLRVTNPNAAGVINWTTEEFTEFDGFRILRDSTTPSVGFGFQIRSGGIKLSNITLMSVATSGTNTGPAGRLRGFNSLRATMHNLVVIGNGLDTGYVTGLEGESLTDMFNCAAYNVFGVGLSPEGGATGNCENCISMDCGTDFNYPGSASSDFCLSSDGTVEGTNSHANETLADIWVDAVSDDFTLVSGSNAHDGGTSQAAEFDTDILGVSRPQGSEWDMGAYELVAAADPAPETYLRRYEGTPAPNTLLRM